jgi:hypothetical protein
MRKSSQFWGMVVLCAIFLFATERVFAALYLFRQHDNDAAYFTSLSALCCYASIIPIFLKMKQRCLVVSRALLPMLIAPCIMMLVYFGLRINVLHANQGRAFAFLLSRMEDLYRGPGILLTPLEAETSCGPLRAGIFSRVSCWNNYDFSVWGNTTNGMTVLDNKISAGAEFSFKRYYGDEDEKDALRRIAVRQNVRFGPYEFGIMGINIKRAGYDEFKGIEFKGSEDFPASFPLSDGTRVRLAGDEGKALTEEEFRRTDIAVSDGGEIQVTSTRYFQVERPGWDTPRLYGSVKFDAGWNVFRGGEAVLPEELIYTTERTLTPVSYKAVSWERESSIYISERYSLVFGPGRFFIVDLDGIKTVYAEDLAGKTSRMYIAETEKWDDMRQYTMVRFDEGKDTLIAGKEFAENTESVSAGIELVDGTKIYAVNKNDLILNRGKTKWTLKVKPRLEEAAYVFVKLPRRGVYACTSIDFEPDYGAFLEAVPLVAKGEGAEGALW